MTTLKIKAKVRITSEDDMEMEEMDLGIIAKSKEWVWRSMGILTYQIYKIMEYNSTKSIVEMYAGEKILVQETFEELYNRWQEAVKFDEIPEINNPEGEEIYDKDDE